MQMCIKWSGLQENDCAARGQVLAWAEAPPLLAIARASILLGI